MSWLSAALLVACAPQGAEVLRSVATPPELAELETPVRLYFEIRHRNLDRALEDPAASDVRQGRAYGAVGQVHLAYGYLQSAKEAFASAMRLDREEPRWPYYQAQVLEAEGLGVEAEELLTVVLRRLPGHLPSLLLLADLAEGRGDLEAADNRWQVVLESDPANVPALAGVSRLALGRGLPEQSLALIERALMRQPASAPLHYQAAMSLRALGDLDAAQEHLDRVPVQNVVQTKLVMDDPWMLEVDQLRIGARFHDQRAQRALAAGRYDVALVELRQSLASNPERVYARYGLGAALAMLGRYEEAVEELRALLAVAPRHVPSLVLLARLLLDQGELDEARSLLHRALQLDPDDADAKVQFARLPMP